MNKSPEYSISVLYKTDDEIETITFIKENIDFIKKIIKRYEDLDIDVTTIENLQDFLNQLKDYFNQNYLDLLPIEENYFLYYEHIFDVFTIGETQRLERLDDYTLASFINTFNIVITSHIETLYDSLENIKKCLNSTINDKD